MSNIAKRIAELSPEKRELLARLLNAERMDAARTVIMPRARQRDCFPLSFAQQRLWFLNQVEPDSPFYNIPDAVYFDGALDLAALEQSFGEIVRRHETLRTTFRIIDDEPVQIIAPPAPIRIEVLDLSQLPREQREPEAQRLADVEAQRTFNLSKGPLLRLRLLKLDAEEHFLLVTMHHIITDGWSLDLLKRELSTLYTAFREGNGSPLAELSVQYADYAVWQREWLTGEVLEEQLRYWREQLAGVLPVLELPADRPRPAIRTYRGAVEAWTIDEHLTRKLKGLGREAGATLFMTLLAAFQILLTRYTGQTDISVGTPIAGRTRAETENLIGFFVNTLVLRTRLRGEMSFRELLAQVRETTLGAYAHQEVPFEKLVEELQPERQTSHTPLFQVVFTIQNFQTEHLNPGATGVETMSPETGTAKFDVRLAVTEEERTLAFSLRYSTDIFDAARIRRMLEHFQNLLASITDNPDRRIRELPLLGASEREQLRTWNDTRAGYPASEKRLHALFEAQVERTPDRVAAVFEREQASYRELNRRANQLAHHLRRAGVGTDALVAICVERSIEMVVGLLGILKAGAAYVPIDPTYPPERIAFMLQDCRAQMLLTQEHLSASLPPSAVRVFRLDADWQRLKDESDADPCVPVAGENLAYMIYTSGSTGSPKGSMNTHAAICNRLLWMQQAYGLDDSDVVLQKTPFSFDVSVWEFFWPLITGARLVLARPGGHQDSAYLVETIAGEGVTTLHFVPSMLQVFLEERGLARCSALRRVICSGEALPRQLQERFFARLGSELHNLYGPTEAAVDVTSWPCVRDDERTAVPIGRPIANTQIYLLDRHLNELPVGIAGELHIGGVALSRGYFGRPDLTAERFIPHPFSDAPGARLYRTGDLAIRLTDGAIEFLGRLDHQVKIRGFRIEPGEIEAALVGHPAVRECVVLVREDRPGDRRLTAYLVCSPDQPAPDVDELRGFLRVKLPEHMIPAAFVSLDQLPLTANGKIDRRALPPPGSARPALERGYVAPRDVLEALLVEMWGELLRVEQIGVEDDFFGLGADSIQGAVFINRLQEKLGEIIHVITIFRFPTIAALAAYLKEQYPEAVGRIDHTDTPTLAADAPTIADGSRQPATNAAHLKAGRVGAAQITRLRRLVKPLAPRPDEPDAIASDKNPPAVFVLSPPRSGSTLFRVMLAGHPALFAPPELELLSFNTLAERRESFSGSQSFWLEGAIRALMEIKNCGADEAKALMEEWERRGLTTKECYRLWQGWLGERRLVDKTPSYALDMAVLQRAEADFHQARYIHLLRHPFGMIRSFEEARLEQIFFRHEHDFTRRELAELIWLVSHENILEFLRSVPPERQLRVHFEELLERPEEVLRGVCHFLELEFAADMLQPYRDKGQRMTDGIHAQSRMLGDVKFHRYDSIDARVGNRWRTQSLEDVLSDETRRIAQMCGYEREPAEEQRPAAARQGLKPISRLAAHTDVELPLSFAQQRLWFIHQLSPESVAYHIPLALRLAGRLDERALERSFGEIVRRHAALRTTFPTVDGQPVQFIAPPQPFSLPTLDLREWPEAAREERAQRLTRGEAQQPFDLERGPLFRARLLKLDAEEHLLLVTMHHIISDGWSMGVLMGELKSLYEAFRAGGESPLAELSVQYADYAVWQREWLTGEVLATQLSYWREQLAGVLPVLELPLDRARPPMQTYRGAVERFELSRAASERLKEIGRKNGATLFMTLLAAFKALLYGYTGQSDVCVGTPIAGRDRAELEQLIGLFVNTLVLRTSLSGRDSFEQLLRRVKEMTLDAYQHQNVPFEKLVEELQPPRAPSHTPFFQVMFTLQDATQEEFSLEGVELGWMETESEIAKFDLSLGMAERDSQLGGAFIYNADLFDAPTVSRLVKHFNRLLEAVAANPQQRLADLPLLTEAESQRLLVEYNDTRQPDPRRACVHQLVEQQAAKRPDAVALSFAGRAMTYGELNERANRLAHCLRRRGVGPEVFVGVLMERSLEMFVALLGILKAGGAYVPLDADYPLERLRFMLDDARPLLVLTEQHLSGKLPRNEAQIVCLDAEWESIARESAADLHGVVLPANLAYIIYTSGSTGRPKGVAIQHGSLANLVRWHRRVYEVTPEDRATQVAGLAFDASVWEMWPYLAAGASIYIADEETRRSPEKLVAWLDATSITLSFLPTPLAEAALNEQWPPGLALRTLLTGGDRLHRPPRAGLPFRLANNYGPTENTVVTTWTFVAGDDESRTPPPIGRPVDNTQVYVLNEGLNLVPERVAGELFVGGCGLARGYWNRPDLTAERFLPNPFSAEPGARLYRTGDRVRLSGEGKMEFLGRVDEQVKVRGYRIELGEVEAQLNRHKTVREAAVLVRVDNAGDKQLVAFVVAERGAEVDVDVWRSYLKESLPDYMIPTAFVLLDEMPLTENGKVNRRALQALKREGMEQRAAFVAPRNALEMQLAHIWEELLNVRPVGIKENFFNLGGHSLLAVRLMARMRKELGCELPLAVILQAQTIEELAGALGPQADARAPSSLVAMQPLGDRPPFFCVHPAGGNVACYSALSRSLGAAQPFYGLRASMLEGASDSATSLEAIAAHYIEAVRSVQSEGPYALGGWSMGGVVAFEMAQQLHRHGQTVAPLVLIDSHAPDDAGHDVDRSDEALLQQFTWYVGRLFGMEGWLMQQDPDEPDGIDELLRSLLAKGVRTGVVPPDLDMVQVKQLFQVFRTNVRAMLDYRPKPYPGSITLLRASRHLNGHSPPPANGWQGLAAGGLEVHTVPGDHFTMMKEPNVQIVAGWVQRCLDRLPVGT